MNRKQKIKQKIIQITKKYETKRERKETKRNETNDKRKRTKGKETKRNEKRERTTTIKQ